MEGSEQDSWFDQAEYCFWQSEDPYLTGTLSGRGNGDSITLKSSYVSEAKTLTNARRKLASVLNLPLNT